MKVTKIILGITGSIAAYKAAELVRLMVTRKWDVFVVMTEAATRFVGPITFQTLSRHPVAVGMFDQLDGWVPEHISLADSANAMVVAPCTANVMAKIAHGLADDMLTCTALACRAPVILAPAMNQNMWDNAATRANVELLQTRGVHLVDVGSGDLACGCEGRGRMAPLEDIMAAVCQQLGARR